LKYSGVAEVYNEWLKKKSLFKIMFELHFVEVVLHTDLL